MSRHIPRGPSSRGRKSTVIVRAFSRRDHVRLIQRLKKYLRATGSLDMESLRKSDPEFAGWVLYTRNRLSELTWAEVEELSKAGFFSDWEIRWLAMYRKLTIFKEVMGHTRVPARWDKNKRLANWVHGHRSARRKTPDHLRKMLDALGFEWKLRDRTPPTAWEDRCAELKAYRERFGHCEVPAKWPENKSLGGWVSTQRRNKHMLSDAQIEKLDALGFNWNIDDERWNQRYEELLAYRAEKGNCRVPEHYAPNPALGLWVANTRRRGDRLTKRQMRKLEKIGFVWDPFDEIWEANFKALEDYIKRYGDALVPAKWEGMPSLGVWVAEQRQMLKKGKLRPERKARLDALGFVWDVKAWQWEQWFDQLVAFKDRFGHCRIPAKGWHENPGLGSWLSVQRQRWDVIPEERRRRLEQLGVTQSIPPGLPENIRRSMRKHRQ